MSVVCVCCCRSCALFLTDNAKPGALPYVGTNDDVSATVLVCWLYLINYWLVNIFGVFTVCELCNVCVTVRVKSLGNCRWSTNINRGRMLA